MVELSLSFKLDWSSLSLKLPLKNWNHVLLYRVSFFRGCALSLKTLQSNFAWSIVVISRLVLLTATWQCWINNRHGYLELLFLLLQLLLNSRPIFEMWPFSLLCRYYFRCSSESVGWIGSNSFFFIRGRSTLYSFYCNSMPCSNWMSEWRYCGSIFKSKMETAQLISKEKQNDWLVSK